MTATKTFIEKIVLTADAASVTFSNIPQTYTDLLLVLSMRTTRPSPYTIEGVDIWFNSDTTSGNYTKRRLLGQGSSASSDTGGALLAPTNGATSSTFSNNEVFVPNYAGSTNKSYSVTSAAEHNSTTAYLAAGAELWSNTDAISSIQLIPTANNFVAGSSFYLYGIQASPNTPILTQGTQTLTSTEVTISNYNAALTYTVTTSAGTASRTGDTITVTGLNAGQTITVTATATDSNGYISATASGSFSAAPIASGGTIIDSGGYRYHRFLSSGNFILNAPKNIEYLIIGGGGGGGNKTPWTATSGGGGGAGGVLNSSIPNASAATYAITVGSGGGSGSSGNNSTAFSLSAIGGGSGFGSPGGSGGGGSSTYSPSTGMSFGSGGSGTPGQGNPGAASVGNPISSGGGGGGGAGGAGSSGFLNPSSGYVGGTGGSGTSIWPATELGSISGGGGGGGVTGGPGGPIGGPGGSQNNSGNPGGSYGSGGGGGGTSSSPGTLTYGGSGFSGAVVIRYLL